MPVARGARLQLGDQGRAAAFDYERMIWGAHEVGMSPVYLGALNLRHALDDLESVGGRILEVGCGAGSMARAIQAHRHDLQITGCDLSMKALKEGRRRSGSIRLLGANAASLPFTSGSFDGVLLFDVLEHLPDPAQAISEASRVLKQNGLVYISVPMEGRLWTLQGLLRRLGWRAFESTVGHIQAFDFKPVRRLLTCAGFKVSRVRWSGHFASQIAHTGYVLWLSLNRGRTDRMSVESHLSRPRGGLGVRLVWALKSVVAALTFAESTILTQVPGAAAHITASRHWDG